MKNDSAFFDRFPENKDIMETRAKHYLPTPVVYHSKDPLQLTKAQGQYVWDHRGKRYLDAIGGIVCISAGHNHPKIKKALINMLENDEIQHTSVLYLSKYMADTAKALAKEAPAGLNRCAFTNSGSEANELAFMAARNATGETMVVNLRHSYHGGTAGTLANCGHHTWRFRSQPVSNVTAAAAPYCYRCPFGQKPESCNLECAKQVEETIQTTTHGKIAAFVAEPVMGVGGFIAPDKEYFEQVVKIVHNYGGKYISDEVQTGAGRGGDHFLYTKTLGIDADIISMAKGFGNGAAVGAVVMKDDIADAMKGKMYFNTFGGDPFQMLQAKLTMEIIHEEKLIENAKAMGKLFKDGALELQKKHQWIGDVRGVGLMFALELVKDRKTKTYATEEAIAYMDICRDKGLLVGRGGLFGNTIRMAPPMNVTKDDIATMLKIMDEAFHDLAKTHPYKG